MRSRLLIGVLLLCGCHGGTRTEDKPLLPLTQLPTAVRRAAYFQNPRLRFHSAWKLPSGGYQIRGLDPTGRNVDVHYSAEGSAMIIN